MKKKIVVPSITEMLQADLAEDLLLNYPRNLVVEHFRKAADISRHQQLTEEAEPKTVSELINEAKRTIEAAYQPTLVRVINATGTVLHTNLGRARLSSKLREELVDIACNYVNVEYTLETGQRGSRYDHLEQTLTKLTGAEAALVVNNNAAAVLLSLTTLAQGKEVIVSRGELVEIGGSFRIPEIMTLGGCLLKEVGTTNKTHRFDYERAIDEDETALLLKVHRSNFSIVGFSESVSLKELKEIGQEAGLPVMYDMGSGSLLSLQQHGLPEEETVQDALAAGADIVTFSGDKLLGGPQAGVIVGKKEYIERMKRHQLTRALRVDKLTIAALEGTLRQYFDEEQAIANIPTLQMLAVSDDVLKAKAETLCRLLSQHDSLAVRLEQGTSKVGGGSMPELELPTWLVSVSPKQMSVTDFVTELRHGKTPVIARTKFDLCLFDVRTITEDELSIVADEVAAVLS